MLISNFKFFLFITTALISVSAANAADLPVPNSHKKATVAVPASAVPKMSWTGFHVGVGGGGTFLHSKSTVDSTVNQSNSTAYNHETYSSVMNGTHNLNGFGGFGNIDAGVDYQNGSFVIGGFADMSFGSSRAHFSEIDNTPSTSTVLDNIGATNTQTHRVSLGNVFDIGGRLGYLATDRTLLYGLAGYSAGYINSASSISVVHDAGSILNSFDLTTQTKGWHSGFTIGSGVEQALTDQITLKVEYRYSEYGHARSSAASDAGGQGSATISQSDAVSTQTVRAVLSYRF